MINLLLNILILSLSGLCIVTLPESVGAIVFVSLDHFLVTLIAACPLAISILIALPVQYRKWWTRLLTLLALAVSFCMMSKLSVSTANELNQISLMIVKILIAFLLAGSLGMNLLRIWEQIKSQSIHHENSPLDLKIQLGVCLLAATLIPLTHTQFLVNYHHSQFDEAMNHQRIEKARINARDWSRLAPQAKWNSLKVTTVYRDLQKQDYRIEEN